MDAILFMIVRPKPVVVQPAVGAFNSVKSYILRGILPPSAPMIPAPSPSSFTRGWYAVIMNPQTLANHEVAVAIPLWVLILGAILSLAFWFFLLTGTAPSTKMNSDSCTTLVPDDSELLFDRPQKVEPPISMMTVGESVLPYDVETPSSPICSPKAVAEPSSIHKGTICAPSRDGAIAQESVVLSAGAEGVDSFPNSLEELHALAEEMALAIVGDGTDVTMEQSVDASEEMDVDLVYVPSDGKTSPFVDVSHSILPKHDSSDQNPVKMWRTNTVRSPQRIVRQPFGPHGTAFRRREPTREERKSKKETETNPLPLLQRVSRPPVENSATVHYYNRQARKQNLTRLAKFERERESHLAAARNAPHSSTASLLSRIDIPIVPKESRNDPGAQYRRRAAKRWLKRQEEAQVASKGGRREGMRNRVRDA